MNVTWRTRSLPALALAAALAGCAAPPVTVSPMPPARYQVLGQAEGKGCGVLGLLATAFYVLPMGGFNERVSKAYQDALASVPGSTALINVSLSEDWTWVLVGTQRCTTLRGDAIREVL